MTRTALAAPIALAALAAAAPAAAAPPPPGQALYPQTVPGAGLGGVAGAQATIRRFVRGHGVAGGAVFRIDLRSGPGQKLVVAVPLARVRFRALRIDTIRFGQNVARFSGIGLVDGRRVGFAAVAVHNALPDVDVFRIAWAHGASIGGRVDSGLVFIR